MASKGGDFLVEGLGASMIFSFLFRGAGDRLSFCSVAENGF